MELGVAMVLSCVTFPWPMVCPGYWGEKQQMGWQRMGWPKQKCIFPSPGAFMGYRSAFQFLFASKDFEVTNRNTDDQCWLGTTFYKPIQAFPANFWKIDSDSRIFLNLDTATKRLNPG